MAPRVGENVDAGQLWQLATELDPCMDEYDPDGHGSQKVEPV